MIIHHFHLSVHYRANNNKKNLSYTLTWKTNLKDKRQVIGMFVSVPWRFPDSHFDDDASYTPNVTAATIALPAQHLSREKPVGTTCKWL